MKKARVKLVCTGWVVLEADGNLIRCNSKHEAKSIAKQINFDAK